MIEEQQLRLLPHQAASEQTIISFLKQHGAGRVDAVRVVKRSIDARRRPVMVNLTVRIYVNELPQDEGYDTIIYGDVSSAPQVVVVGAGPAGLFASLRLIEAGLRPILVERGKDVHARRRDVALIGREHRVDPESNYGFGEGGAGAFSDGKLYTRSKKRGNVNRILNILCQHGASISILADAHPHIGTDKLPRVIENIRNQIIRSGGEVHFETRMTSLMMRQGTVVGITTACGKEFRGPVILATGHSARDVYYYMHDAGIALETKGIAVGVRLEHPQHLIDTIQYHTPEGRGKYLPAAEYSFVTQVAGRGVYSFCMCPGGFVVPAATGPEQLVVNGMSPSNRGSRWANSGMVVEMQPHDYPNVEKYGVLAGIKFQEELERMCYVNGNCRQTAPAQRMMDFVNRRNSSTLAPSSYAPGLVASPLHFWLPEHISMRLREGFKHFGKVSRGFLTNEATMIGVESRTSSPVRIPRDNERMSHIIMQGLFPCGEGAGYAGGIVSAAIDGERCAEAVAAQWSELKTM